ncbi:unnamed protein product [Nesidiocoris tenuis]|uniref:Uncharacterized protein n=1 Tax=Nesidiocoris tenuis TaxID=355587 RepID=A0A6H5GHS0_9HEMI|nr:unnamed protein product [Nesidiocoris tenuis]
MTSTDANGSSTRQSRKSEERKLSSPKKSTGFQSGTPKSGKRLVRTSTKGARSNRITQDTKATSGAAEMQEGETNLKKSKESKSSDTKKPHRKSKAKSISGRLAAKNEAKQSPKRDQRKSKSPTSEKPKKSSATKRSATEKSRRSMRKSREKESPDKAEVGQKSKRGSRRKSDRKSTSRERSPKKKRKGPPRPSDAKSTKSKKKSRASQASSKQKKGSGDKNAKKGKKVKEKVVKLNRKAIYKDLRNIEKTIAGENQKRQRLQWDKDKLYFYWNCAVGKLLEMNKTNSNLKKKLEKLNLEVKHALPGEYWKKMHQARLSREEKLQARNEEFAAMIVQLRDAQKAKADSLFKAIQTEVNDTYLVGQRYLSDVIGIRKEYTENLTATLFEAREKMRVLEIEMNCKYAPILEEFEEEMKKIRNQVPKERQERYWGVHFGEGSVRRERALQLTNYNATVKHLFNVEENFLEDVKTFKNHEEFEDVKEGVKVSFGSYHPHTLEELERETEEFEGSLHTAIIFFRKRLRENFLSLDDLHFFIKRRSPLAYMKKVAQEENELLKKLKSDELDQENSSKDGQYGRIFFV